MHSIQSKNPITGRQIAAARVLAGVGQDELARSAKVSLSTLRRMEGSAGAALGYAHNVDAVITALEAFRVEFPADGKLGVLMKAPELLPETA